MNRVTSPTSTAPAADVLPLCPDFVRALLAVPNHPRVTECARAYVIGYEVALSLGFGEDVARRQAAQRWDLARTAPRLVWP